MTEPDQFADRVERLRAIVKSLYGSVLDRDGDTVWCEIPADLIGGFGAMCTMSGFFPPSIKAQTTRPAPVRVIDTNGHTIVCDKEPWRTMAYYRYAVDLRPHHVAVDHTGRGHAAAITAPTKPRSP
jgi:hypothetical protein